MERIGKKGKRKAGELEGCVREWKGMERDGEEECVKGWKKESEKEWKGRM